MSSRYLTEYPDPAWVAVRSDHLSTRQRIRRRSLAMPVAATPRVGAQRMDNKIALFITRDLHTVGSDPQFSGNANSLAVAVHENAGGQGVHGNILGGCTYGSVCISRLPHSVSKRFR